MFKKTTMVIIGLLLILSACTPSRPETEEMLIIEDDKLYVAIIWHQHQPVYFKDPDTGLYEKPWVRVHATKDYLDMLTILADYPDIKATYNITPSLIRQLDDFSAGAKDKYWVIAEIPAEDLTADEKRFLLERFFDINQTIIHRFPRYQKLSDSRSDLGVDGAIESWSTQDFRDLQILFNLAWVDPDWLAAEPLKALVEKGSGYSEADKVILFAEHLRIIQEVIPTHAAYQQSGQIEVTMTPFAHPILPLLVDSNLAYTALPDAELPSQFMYGRDAIAQIDLGIALYEDHFGQTPRGMWPAEGSVAEEIVNMIGKAGIQWIASDEDVLAESLPDFEGFTRNSADTVLQSDQLYRPYTVRGSRDEPVSIIFRDHLISDRVGFEYSGMPGDEAAEDLIQRLNDIQAQLDTEGAEGPNLVTVLLDGENAWEHYENDGKEFLHGLYQGLSESDNLVTVTPSEYLAVTEQPRELETLWPGSWIDGTYSTWIGEGEENLAWEYLNTTREALQLADFSGEIDEAVLEEAFLNMYLAEGSDWFWWYGSDQNSGSDDSFDQQFRSYLEQVYLLIGEPVPGFVYVPVIPERPQQPEQDSRDLLTVGVDGIASDDEWGNAAFYSLDEGDFSALYYGFDQETLYLRLDSDSFDDDTTLGFYLNIPESLPTNPYSRYGEGETLFGFGAKRLIEISFESGEPVVSVYQSDKDGVWITFEIEDGTAAITAALSNGVLEVSAPFASFAPNTRSGDRINMRLITSEGESDTGIIPTHGPALLTIPDLPIPNIFLTVEDPEGDDHGPGTYTYPTDEVFSPGVFDMISFTVGYDDEDIIFRVAFRGDVENVWGSPNGLSVQTIDIYVDTDGAANGDRQLLPGRNAALSPDFAWDYAIWAEGWNPGIYAPGDDGPVQIDRGFTIITNPGKQRVTIRVPRSLIEGDPETWAFAVTIGSQEGFPSSGVWRLRDVQAEAVQWRIGGGLDNTNQTRLMDILVPVDASLSQEELLSGYPSSQEDVDLLEPDDFPQVGMVQVPQ